MYVRYLTNKREVVNAVGWLDEWFSEIGNAMIQDADRCFDAIDNSVNSSMRAIEGYSDDCFRELESLYDQTIRGLYQRSKELVCCVGNEYKLAYEAVKRRKAEKEAAKRAAERSNTSKSEVQLLTEEISKLNRKLDSLANEKNQEVNRIENVKRTRVGRYRSKFGDKSKSLTNTRRSKKLPSIREWNPPSNW